MQKNSTLVSSSKVKKNKQQPEISVDLHDPSDSLVQNILNYSKSLTIQKSKLVDFIEIVAS